MDNKKKIIKETELILNNDGSIYHLKLRPENISDNIILVGDPERVNVISDYFSKIECKVQNREFISNTGIYNGKRITVISTGIGTDNIDIVMNELDALVNIDFYTREIKNKKTSLNVIRLGTSGSLQKDIPVDSYVVSEYGLGLDGLLNFYKHNNAGFDEKMTEAFIKNTQWNQNHAKPYIVKASDKLLEKMGTISLKGITATASGFYGPQGRLLRIESSDILLNDKLSTFEYNGKRITNFEMETSAIYGLGSILGHQAITICTIIANRVTNKFSKDYKRAINKITEKILEIVTI